MAKREKDKDTLIVHDPKIVPTCSYFEDGVLIQVCPYVPAKKRMWMKNDTFYAGKMRIEERDGNNFAHATRRKGKG
jgi:hypothetical protein